MLPSEVIEIIADALFETRLPASESADSLSVSYTKPAWNDVVGFMSATIDLHRMGYIRWIRVLTVKDAKDWEILLPDAIFVCELNCIDGTLGDPSQWTILCRFDHLFAVTVDAHGDVIQQRNGHFVHRDLVAAFPPSLRYLTVTNAHGPDMNIIKIIKQSCPQLERLTLQRCTMFSRAPVCDFWLAFPLNHDSYISTEGTDDYAHSLAQELVPLRNLKLLHIGLYFAPSTIVLAHRVYHRRGLPAPENLTWQQAINFAQQPADIIPGDMAIPAGAILWLVSILREADTESEFGPTHSCELCFQATSQISTGAETRANAILRNSLPSLRESMTAAPVSLMSMDKHGDTGDIGGHTELGGDETD